jgi:hypothetical protein
MELFDVADIQLVKLTEVIQIGYIYKQTYRKYLLFFSLLKIFIFYDQKSELYELFKSYVAKNSNYINAYKYLYQFQKFYDPSEKMPSLQVTFQIKLIVI